MRGKVLFVVGLGIGYLLGTRAGRRRYEQIKATALNFWESEPVQWGVAQVQDAAGDLADQAIAKAKSVISQAQGTPQKTPPGTAKPRANAKTPSTARKQPPATAEKRASARPQPKPASPMAEPSARSGVATGAIPVIPTKPTE
jgi:hypothetical protein